MSEKEKQQNQQRLREMRSLIHKIAAHKKIVAQAEARLRQLMDEEQKAYEIKGEGTDPGYWVPVGMFKKDWRKKKK